MGNLEHIDGLLAQVQTDLVEALLSRLVEETVASMVGPYTVPLGEKPTAKPPGIKRCEYTPNVTAFTYNQDKNSWDLCDDSDEEMMWSPWGHPGESKKSKSKKNETGHLAYIARRGMLPSPERAV